MFFFLDFAAFQQMDGRRAREEEKSPEDLYAEFVRDKFDDLPPGWERVKRNQEDLYVDHISREAWTEPPAKVMQNKGQK